MACMNAFYIPTQMAVDSFACEDKINELFLNALKLCHSKVGVLYQT